MGDLADSGNSVNEEKSTDFDGLKTSFAASELPVPGKASYIVYLARRGVIELASIMFRVV